MGEAAAAEHLKRPTPSGVLWRASRERDSSCRIMAANLTINSSGPFTFTTQLVGGSAYSVAISTEPSNPAQTCHVVNGSGTVHSNVTNIFVNCIQNATPGLYLFESTSLTSLNLATIDTASGAVSAATLLDSHANGTGFYPSMAVTPSQQVLYALYTSFSIINAFSISGPGLQLRPLPDAPFQPQQSGGVVSMVLHPNGKYLYVIESPGKIEEFSIDPNSGDLAHASGLTESAEPGFTMMLIDPQQKFLFAPDLGNGQIFVYEINQSDGSLSVVLGSPFKTPIIGAGMSVLDSTGKFIYAPLSDGTGIAGFAIDSSTGAVSTVSVLPFLTSNRPVSLAADPNGNFVYTCNADGTVNAFAIDPSSGALTAVGGSPFVTATIPSSIVIDPSGKFLYVAISSPQSGIYGFSIDPITGSLSALPASPFPSVPFPTNLSIFDIQ